MLCIVCQMQSSLECLSLTIDEVMHIRRVLTKAEVESLLFDPVMQELVARAKVCMWSGINGVLEMVVPGSDQSWLRIVIIILVPPPVACQSKRALPVPGTADGYAISRCQVLGRTDSVHHGANQ